MAKNDVVHIMYAVKAYYTEYGRYPLLDGREVADVTYAANNARLFEVLRGVQNTTDADMSDGRIGNPRGIAFIEIPKAKNGRAGMLEDGTWVDPWGKPYFICIDANYDGKVSDPTGGSDIAVGVIAWSWGKDGKPGYKSWKFWLKVGKGEFSWK